MTYCYWMGTDDSWLALQELETQVAELRKSAMSGPEKQAFLFFDDFEDEDTDTRMGAHLIERLGDLAILKVGGSLVSSHSGWHKYFPGKITSYDAIIGASRILAEEDNVSKVVLKVNSGGGAVAGVSRASEALRRLDARKPVIAHVDDMAFSAGYWVASSAREIVAGDKMTEFGSIGTLAVHVSRARMAESMGLDVEVFRAGEFKAIGHPMEKLTEAGKEHIQADVHKANSFFLGHVSMRRNLMVSAKGVWAEGKTFFAEEAQTVGLVDRVEPLEDLVIRASGAANHRNRSYEMKISADKLASIEAGARPEDVLNAEELTQYKASIGASENEEEEQELNDTEASENEEEDDEEHRQSNSVTADVTALLKENGKLEARLEAKDEKIAELTGKLEAQSSTFKSLMAIGVHAVQNRQVALNIPKTTPQTAEELITAFHDLSTEMSARFTVGQKSAAVNLNRDAECSDIPRHMQARKGI